MKYIAMVILLCLMMGGCATTYVPISRGYRSKAQELSRSDPTLAILFDRYDPKRQTLRFDLDSFQEAMWPSEVQYHRGAYRSDTGLIYTNLYLTYSDAELRELLIHEMAHHIWFKHMSAEQREGWKAHLEETPCPMHDVVRELYRESEYWSEDFAFTMQYARPGDFEELASLKLITPRECQTLISERKRLLPPAAPSANGGPISLGSSLSTQAAARRP